MGRGHNNASEASEDKIYNTALFRRIKDIDIGTDLRKNFPLITS
jgi:hypothetical protein